MASSGTRWSFEAPSYPNQSVIPSIYESSSSMCCPYFKLLFVLYSTVKLPLFVLPALLCHSSTLKPVGMGILFPVDLTSAGLDSLLCPISPPDINGSMQSSSGSPYRTPEWFGVDATCRVICSQPPGVAGGAHSRVGQIPTPPWARGGRGRVSWSRQLLAELSRRAWLFNNALINYCKLQRTQLTLIERSTEAAMKLDVHTNY